MTSATFLMEDIKDVFSIFDEDGSGTISLQELGRALYTITGQRVPRSELLRLIAYAQEIVAKEQQQQQQKQSASSLSEEVQPQASGDDLHESSEQVAEAQVMPLEEGNASEDAEAPSRTGSPQGASLEISPSELGGTSGNDGTSGGVDGRPSSQADSANAGVSGRTNPRAALPQKMDFSEGIDIDIFVQVVLRKLNSRSYEEELAFTFSLLEDKSYTGFITRESLHSAAATSGEPLTEAEVHEMFDSLVTGVPTAAVDLATFTELQIAAKKLESS